jgi:hypothetical protein
VLPVAYLLRVQDDLIPNKLQLKSTSILLDMNYSRTEVATVLRYKVRNYGTSLLSNHAPNFLKEYLCNVTRAPVGNY